MVSCTAHDALTSTPRNSHSVDGDTLRVTLHHGVDVNTRAAATGEIEALVHAHRPRRVSVQVPAGEPTPVTLSVVVRAHRMCKGLDISLSLTGASSAAQRLFTANTPRGPPGQQVSSTGGVRVRPRSGTLGTGQVGEAAGRYSGCGG
ncbi:hypothetical protein ACFC96_13630 [Streptomyces sp. NPDC055955]|uniref:hypothetical protein n=1 Tax=Streptomyces sp. NPDC055955 TaxID=3345665 RepID=UPI0035DA84A7